MPATDPDQAVKWAIGRARIPLAAMLREIDLQCSDCGGELVERDVDPRTLSLASAIEGSITIAECPACGARYYPEQSLSKLSISGGQIEEGG